MNRKVWWSIYQLVLYGDDLKKYMITKNNKLTPIRYVTRYEGELTLQEWIDSLNEGTHT